MSNARDMELMDYFAAQAMASYVARNTAGQWDSKEIALMSYNVAYAMVEERRLRSKL